MGRTQKILLVVLLVVAGGVVYVATRNRQPPLLPVNADHRTFNILECKRCHDPGGELPRGRNHPVGDDCTRCHGLQ